MKVNSGHISERGDEHTLGHSGKTCCMLSGSFSLFFFFLIVPHSVDLDIFSAIMLILSKLKKNDH